MRVAEGGPVMKLIVDASTLRGLGSSSVGRGIVGALARMRDTVVKAWIPQNWSASFDKQLPDTAEVERVPAGGLAKLAAENLGIRRWATQWRADAVFSLGDTGLLASPVPHLLLVQTPYLAYGPAERDFRMPLRFRAMIAVLERYFAAGLKSVSAITVQSEHMRRCLAARWDYPVDRIFVVPSAVDDVPTSADSGHAGPYVVYPASPSAHKNFAVLPRAMRRLRDGGLPLRCVLTAEEERLSSVAREAAALGVREQFSFVGSVSPGRARQLMAGAAVVVLPAKLETFGLPYYEAMALGRPIVAADRECAREACGPAALYADADSGDAFSELIAKVIESDAIRRTLRDGARARTRAARCTWADVAERYRCLLEMVSIPRAVAPAGGLDGRRAL